MKVINPKVDKVIAYIKRKINIKVLKTGVIITIILLFINCVVSGIAIDLYLMRQAVEKDLDVPNKEQRIEDYNRIYLNEKYKSVINKYWNNEKMVLTYPNLTITLKDGTTKRVREYLPEIKPYYHKFNVKSPSN